MKNKSIALIGGTGFIGTNFIYKYQSTFRSIICIANDQQRFNSHKFAENVLFVKASSTKEELISFLKAHEVEFLIDLAYSTVPKTSFEDPLNDIISNLHANVNTFEWVKQLDLKKIIWVSTGGAIYGQTESLLIDEFHPVNPISPYGITKLAIEKYAYMYHKIFNLPIVCLRPSNVFGPHQIPYRGQGFIATAIASIMEGKTITVFGSKGSVRDYLYIEDLITAIYLCLTLSKNGEVYNIGTGIGMNNLDILNNLSEKALSIGKEVKIIIKDSRPFDVDYNVLDSSKFIRQASWDVKNNFSDSLAKTWQWYMNSFFQNIK